jgi:DNA-binding SARP family transcriptional activator/Tfp pilus assembly protein PilF
VIGIGFRVSLEMQKRVSPGDLAMIVPLETARSADPLPSGRKTIARIHLLGAMRATSYLGNDILPKGRKAKALLGCLCLASGQKLARSRLASMLWDRVSDFQARASFRQAYRELVVAFGPLAKELISGDRETIVLNKDACWIDALAILEPEMAQNAHRSELAAYCSGELLEELGGVSVSFDHWLLGERTRFIEQRRALLEAELSHARGQNRDANERADIARRLIMFDAAHEGASRILMRALADLGERAQALREYARLRGVLRNSLDVEPSPETNALYEAIRMFTGREERDDSVVAPVAAPRKKGVKATPHEPVRNRLRVGVLPFLATGTIADDSLALSLSQEISAALARFRWFDVIAPVALIRGAAAGAEDTFRQNELDYVVDGALSGGGEKYQISVRLLDLTKYATPVWSDRFELDLNELHKLDEVVTAPIAARIDPIILFIEGQPKRREKPGATTRIMQAIPMIYTWEREKFERAGELIDEALEIEPNNAMVLAWAAHWRMSHVGQGWTTDARGYLESAEELCLRAIRIDPDNAEALGIYAHTCSWKKDFDSALHHFDRALRSNPNLAWVWALSAMTHCYVGKPDEALRRMDRYRALAPFDPYFCFFESIYATAYLFRGDYKDAIVYGRRAAKANPQFINGYKPLIASLGHLGELEEARTYVDKVLAMEPEFTARQFGEVYPFKRQVDRERYCEGLRLAGVPEG